MSVEAIGPALPNPWDQIQHNGHGSGHGKRIQRQELQQKFQSCSAPKSEGAARTDEFELLVQKTDPNGQRRRPPNDNKDQARKQPDPEPQPDDEAPTDDGDIERDAAQIRREWEAMAALFAHQPAVRPPIAADVNL